MEDELVDRITGRNAVIEAVSKHAAHRHGWLHRTVIADAHDHEGRFVLARPAAGRQDAGQYVCPVGGHVKAGESNLEALRREAFEEIGTTNFTAKLVTKFTYERHVIGRHENHYFIIFNVILDPSDITLGPEFVDQRIFSIYQLKAALTETPEIFGAAYIALLEHCYPDLLP